jgi:hypothetical protein
MDFASGNRFVSSQQQQQAAAGEQDASCWSSCFCVAVVVVCDCVEGLKRFLLWKSGCFGFPQPCMCAHTTLLLRSRSRTHQQVQRQH